MKRSFRFESIYIPEFLDFLVLGNTNFLTFLLFDSARNHSCLLNTFLVAFLLHLEISDEGNNIMANILAGFLVRAKLHRFRLLTISFGRATGDG